MPMRYDSAVKTMVVIGPTGIPEAMKLTHQRVDAVDTDVSIVSAATDAAVKITDEHGTYLLHMEFQSRYDETFLSRANMYRAIYHHRTQLHVKTVLIFLTKHAWRAAYNGDYKTQHGPDEVLMAEPFEVLKVWELPQESLLADVGTLPLVALTPFDRDGYADLLERIDQALAEHPHRADLLAITHVLAGLRDDGLQFAEALNTRFPVMEDSLTYQKVRQLGVEEGRQEGIRLGEERGIRLGEERGRDAGMHAAIYALAEARLGTPDGAMVDALNAIHDADRLRRLVIEAAKATSWTDLLDTP